MVSRRATMRVSLRGRLLLRFERALALIGVVGGDGPDVGVVVAVGIGRAAIAGEGDGAAVGRPCGRLIVVIAAGDLGLLLVGEGERVKVSATAVEVADFVFFEMETVDHPGMRLGFGVFVFRELEFVDGGILQNEDEAPAIGRPGEGIDVLNGV